MKPIALVMGTLLLAACSSPRSAIPEVRLLYRDAARRETRNPVVVIHGILGSRLEQRSTGKTVWGAFTSEAIDPETPEGARAMALPLEAPASALAYDPETTPVFAAGPLGAIRLSILFAVINVQVYADILRSLGVGGYTDPVQFDPSSPEYATDHYTCFTFFYDWRRDNVENAIQFSRYLTRLRGDVQRRARNRIEGLRSDGDEATARELEAWLQEGFRFDVVAHSMGGLIARYFLRFGAQDLPADGSLPQVTWAGAEQIERLVMVGTPNLGSMESLQTLMQGFTPGFLLPHYHHVLLGTMPAIYQLMPRNGQEVVLDATGDVAELDLFDVEQWDRNGWGLLDPEDEEFLAWLQPGTTSASERRECAKDYLRWCLQRARRFHAALDQDARTPSPAEIRLFAADTIPTLARTRLVERGGRLRLTFDGDSLRAFGDGTVARYSAVGDRRVGPTRGWLEATVPWSSVTFLPDDHIGLTKNPLFTNNLLFFLLEQRPRAR